MIGLTCPFRAEQPNDGRCWPHPAGKFIGAPRIDEGPQVEFRAPSQLLKPLGDRRFRPIAVLLHGSNGRRGIATRGGALAIGHPGVNDCTVFHTVTELQAAITRFIDAWNENCDPFT